MKSKFFLLAAFAVINFTACSTTSSTQSAQQASASETTPVLRVGMTKNEVIAAWGEPSARQISASGEIWTWGGQNWKRMIPYAGPFMNVQTSKAVFGSNGRVKDFRLTDKGDMMSQAESMMPGAMPW